MRVFETSEASLPDARDPPWRSVRARPVEPVSRTSSQQAARAGPGSSLTRRPKSGIYPPAGREQSPASSIRQLKASSSGVFRERTMTWPARTARAAWIDSPSVDAAGRHWIVTRDGLSCLEKARFKPWTTKDGQRFLVCSSKSSSQCPITVVVSWQTAIGSAGAGVETPTCGRSRSRKVWIRDRRHGRLRRGCVRASRGDAPPCPGRERLPTVRPCLQEPGAQTPGNSGARHLRRVVTS